MKVQQSSQLTIFGSDGGVEWLYVACGGWVFCSGKQSVVKDFTFLFLEKLNGSVCFDPKIEAGQSRGK